MNNKKNWRIILARIKYKEWMIYLFVLLMTIVLCKCIVFLGVVPSGSMMPTIKEGDIIVGSRISAKEIERYDVIIFRYPDDPSQYFVKRVIGLPGERIEIRNGVVYADDNELKDIFVEARSVDSGTYNVPENSYFVLGDNRNNSNDSRFWDNKYVRNDMILAKVKYVLWHDFRKID